MDRVLYFDNAATTPVRPEVIQAITECLKNDFGNPSSLHRLGIAAEKRMKESRENVAAILKVKPGEIIFTSGGTEANNLAIIGGAYANKRKGKHCITTTIEHPSVLNAFSFLEREGFDVTYLSVDKNGIVDLNELERALRPDTILVSIMHVNNEIGSIQPIKEIGTTLKNHEAHPLFHVDSIQSFGKIDFSPEEWNIDLLSLSGHKIHAPKGVGALYIKSGTIIRPLLWGGEQENSLRSGTENLPGIVGIGKACELINGKLDINYNKMDRLKKLFRQGIESNIPEAIIHGNDEEKSVPYIISISFPGIPGEVLLHALEEKGVYVSTGSACSSRKKKISHVLRALGLDDKTAEGTVRFSFSPLNTEEEVNAGLEILIQSIKQLRRFKRR